jgi:hypothetical protein
VKLDPKPKRVALEEMSAGLSIGHIVNQQPGTYYFLAKVLVGKKTYEIKTQTFVVKAATNASAESATPTELEITLTPFEFWQTPADHEYRLRFLAPAERSMMDVTGKLSVTCSQKITLYEKGNSVSCDKKKRMIYASLNDLDAHFFVDVDDLQKPVEIKAEFITKNAKNKTVTKLKNSLYAGFVGDPNLSTQ